MNGADYIAVVRLSTKANDTLALPGETCERVPASSLSWLVAQGLIEYRPAPVRGLIAGGMSTSPAMTAPST